MSILEISFPDDFIEKYQQFSGMLSDILNVKDPPIFSDADVGKEIKQVVEIENTEPNDNSGNTSAKPYTVVKDGIGYFKFFKEGENIKIGKVKTRQFKLLQSLTEPNFGVQKTIEAVFEAIKQPQDDNDSRLSGLASPATKTRMLEIIEYTKKELQKIKELQGKINYCMDDKKQKMWLK